MTTAPATGATGATGTGDAASRPLRWPGEARLGAGLAAAAAASLALLAAGQAAGLGQAWPFSLAGPLAAALAVTLAAALAGGAVVRVLTGLGPGDPLGRHLALPAGLVLLALAGFGVGAAGRVSPALLSLLLAVPFAALAAHALTSGTAAEAVRDALSFVGRNATRPDAWLLAPPLVLALCWASLPPTFYDAVAVHLALPNLYLNAGSLVVPEGFSVAGYPQYAEMITLWPLALGGETAASLLNAVVAVAAALSLRSMLERRLGRWPAALGALFVACQWPFAFEAAFLKNDLLAALLLFSALRVQVESGVRRTPGRAALAGALVGAAIGVKWLAALPAALLVLASLPELRRAPRRAAVFAAAAALLVAPWLVRNALHFGNPVYPASVPYLAADDGERPSPTSLGRSTGMALDRSPGAAWRRVASIGWSAEHGSGGEASVLLLPLLAAGVLFARDRRERALSGLGLAVLVLGVGLVSAYLRLFFLAILLAGVAAAAVVERARPGWRVLATGVLLAGSLVALVDSIAMADRLTDRGSRVLLGRESVDAWLERQVNYLPLVGDVARLPPDARILVVGSARTAYLPRRAEANYPWDEPWIAGARRRGLDHGAMTRELRERGFSHVLLNAFDMDLLERSEGRFGHRGSEEIRRFYDGWFATLEPLAARNEAVLFRLPDGPRG